MKKLILIILVTIFIIFSSGQIPIIAQEIYCGPGNIPTSIRTDKIYTAIGCIPLGDAQSFIVFILRWALGIAGGIAFLLTVFASFQIITSSGNPEKIQAAKELLVSAIGGLILLILSFFILDLIGIDLLRLPKSLI